MKTSTVTVKTLLLCATIFAITTQHHLHAAYQFSDIQELHLATLPVPIQHQQKHDPTPKKKSLFEQRTGAARPDYELGTLSDYERHVTVYELFSKLAPTHQITPIINKNVRTDLELLGGGNLFKRLDRTHTTLGSVYLASLLTHPINDVAILKQRQKFIDIFVIDEKLNQKLSSLLAELKQSESVLLSFWREEKSAEKIFIDQLYTTNPHPLLKGLRIATTSPAWQEFFTLSRHFFFTHGMALLNAGYFYGAYSQYHYGTLYGPQPRGFNVAICSFFAAAALIQNYQEILVHKNYCDMLNYLHKKTNVLASFVQILDTTVATFEKHPELWNMETAQLLRSYQKKEASLSPKLQKLIGLLQTKTFRGTASIFSRKGRVRAAYALMKEVKDELAPYLLVLGELDAYNSCATLYKEYAAQANAFTFATYLENQPLPSLNAQDIWNPFLDPKKAIVNSIQLGTPLPANIILTGPNAGGKSTFIKGITLNILLGQTIGLVPARSCTFTPFANINTYMNIADDIAVGKSLFKSEVIRAQELVDSIQTAPHNAFVFSVMDEMFSGTSPKEGEAASYAVAENLGKYPHSILLLATHFPKLKRLERTTGRFKNYQVRVVHQADGSFTYPFKVEVGAADQNLAIDILKQQGFSSSVLDRAQEILKEPNA